MTPASSRPKPAVPAARRSGFWNWRPKTVRERSPAATLTARAGAGGLGVVLLGAAGRALAAGRRAGSSLAGPAAAPARCPAAGGRAAASAAKA